MTRKNNTSTDDTDTESTAPDKVAIEGKLPLTAIDIESQKDMMSGRYHPLRSLHKWFAARPTPAARLAVLASAYPGDIDSDKLLKLMQIGKKEWDNNIAGKVEEKFNEDRTGSGTVDDHYGYPNPNTQTPTESEIEDLQETLREGWGGELPTVLDPTCGRGIIPFEAMRYGFPVVANELNPIPTLISKVALEYAPEVGSVTPEIYEWRDKIHKTAKDNIKEYYATEEEGREILNSAFTYLIECDSCGGDIPLVMKWWLNQTGSGARGSGDAGSGDAVKPIYESGEVSYEHIKVQDAPDGYDPNDAPVSRGDAECPHCGVVTDSDTIRERINDGAFEYSVYGVNYKTPDGENHFRAGGKVDKKSTKLAQEYVESDFDMMDFLSEPIEGGLNQNQIKRMGMEQWRDIFTPRQLVTHYEYLQAYNKYKDKIRDKYKNRKADAILTLLSFSATKCVEQNSRLVTWYATYGYGGYMFADNNYSIKKMGADNNISSSSRKGYPQLSEYVISSYEEISDISGNTKSRVENGDAGSLTSKIGCSDVDVSVVDPPYYSSIMYAELSDIFYALQKEYLSDIHPELFNSKLSNKEDEAVANPSRFEDIVDDDSSKKKMADEYYEEKMEEIFNETYQSLSDNGVMTVMFTHREMDAWDTLTSALIKSGFVITASHPVKTEMADRIGVRGDDSADSSILLTARKQSTKNNKTDTLWNDVKDDIYSVAEQEAKDIINSDYHISKTDTAIAAYGPTLKEFVKAHPVVNKNGEELRPREALSEARQAVTSVLVEEYLNINSVEKIDSLTRWYILIWLIYENDTVLSDEARQIGRAADIDIDDVGARSDTKIWGKSSGDVQLKNPSERVQDIVKLESEEADDPSSRTYPVDPTSKSFQNAIDSVHSAVHVYDREGSDRTLQWLKERNMDAETEFHITIIALLQTMPSGNDIRETLQKLVKGQTGEYLDIDLTTYSSTADPQTDISEWVDQDNNE